MKHLDVVSKSLEASEKLFVAFDKVWTAGDDGLEALTMNNKPETLSPQRKGFMKTLYCLNVMGFFGRVGFCLSLRFARPTRLLDPELLNPKPKNPRP